MSRHTERPAEPARDADAVGVARVAGVGVDVAVLIAIIGLLAYVVRWALLPFVFSAAVAFVIDPLIRAAQQRTGLSRGFVGAIVCGVAFLALGTAAYWGSRLVVPAIGAAIADAPATIERAATTLIGPNGARIFGRTYTPAEIAATVSDGIADAVRSKGMLSIGALGMTGIFGIVLTLVLVPYFVISGPRLVSGTLWLVPPRTRRQVAATLDRVAPLLRRYVAGVGAVVLVTATVAWCGFGPLFHLPHAVLLAIVVGTLEIIPVIGPITSATIVMLIAMQQHTVSAAAGLAAFAMSLRFAVDNVVGPIVLGTAARLHPVVVIFSFLCGGALFGLLGVVLAVPVAAAIRIVVARHYASAEGTRA